MNKFLFDEISLGILSHITGSTPDLECKFWQTRSQKALYPNVEILVVDREPAWFGDKSGPVAKWIRRRFPTPEIAGSSPARVDQNFSIKN